MTPKLRAFPDFTPSPVREAIARAVRTVFGALLPVRRRAEQRAA